MTGGVKATPFASKEAEVAEDERAVKARTPEDGDAEVPPVSAGTVADSSPEDWRNAGLEGLLLLAQGYYRLLDLAVCGPCAALDLNLNHSYLWIVKTIRTLLTSHADLADFPMPFEPALPDLSSSTVLDADWESMIAPGAEGFVCAVQEYLMDKGSGTPPEEGKAAWVFLETVKAGVRQAIETGEAYQKRMTQYFQRVADQARVKAAGRCAGSGGPAAEPASSRQTPQDGLRPKGAGVMLGSRTETNGERSRKAAEGVSSDPARTPCFYLFGADDGTLSRTSVFYRVQGDLLAERLLALFREQFGEEGADEYPYPTIHVAPADSVSAEERAALDEVVRELSVYDEPDASKNGLRVPVEAEVRVGCRNKALKWEALLRQKRAVVTENGSDRGNTPRKPDVGRRSLIIPEPGSRRPKEDADGTRYVDYNEIHTFEFSAFPYETGPRELLIGGVEGLGCYGRKYRILTVFECKGPGEVETWPLVDVWDPKAKEDKSCFLLTWEMLVYDKRDAFRIVVKLTFESKNEALKVSRDYPSKILVETLFDERTDDEKITVCFFSNRSVVRTGVDTGVLLLDEATQAERMRLAVGKVEPKGGGVGDERAVQSEDVRSVNALQGPQSDGGRAPATEQQFKPMDDNWGAVSWKGVVISLRKREKAKEFLRMLWDNGANCRSKASSAGKRFEKPSSLFGAGGRFVSQGTGLGREDTHVKSDIGEMIHRVYTEAVGKVQPAKKGKGRTKYYLRVFAHSDST